MDYIAILGRQHEIGIAELESLYGPGSIMGINSHACFVDAEVDFGRLGSSVKLARYIETLPTTDIAAALNAAAPLIIEERKHARGKLKLGVSVYGARISSQQLMRASLGLKKKLRSKGLSVRLVPNNTQQLNAAQVLNNKLAKQNGFELNVIIDGKRSHLAKTVAIQDIDAYARRDREKPVRDTLVGMLPPKLAQTLINLANAQPGDTLLDPFCGTGTVLMEAHEMGISTIGSDISPDMVEATRVNMHWLAANRKQPKYTVELADATEHVWEPEIGAVAGETFLGPALRTLPEAGVLERIVEEVNDIHERFLKNLASQLKSGTRIALAVPAWHKNGRFLHLPCLDYLEDLGYNPVSFVHTSDELVYHRPQQVVGRRILILVRK